jgi:hypothetical protein
VVQRLKQEYEALAAQTDGAGFLRGLETYLQALDEERQARHVVAALRAEFREAAERLAHAKRGAGDAAEVQERQVRALPGFAEERLRLVSEALAAAEPTLVGHGEPEAEYAQRASLHGIDQLPSIKLMRKALAGEMLSADEVRALEGDVAALREDAGRLQDELVQRLARRRVERRRASTFINRFFHRT